jgi:hypothetical protein
LRNKDSRWREARRLRSCDIVGIERHRAGSSGIERDRRERMEPKTDLSDVALCKGGKQKTDLSDDPSNEASAKLEAWCEVGKLKTANR